MLTFTGDSASGASTARRFISLRNGERSVDGGGGEPDRGYTFATIGATAGPADLKSAARSRGGADAGGPCGAMGWIRSCSLGEGIGGVAVPPASPGIPLDIPTPRSRLPRGPREARWLRGVGQG